MCAARGIEAIGGVEREPRHEAEVRRERAEGEEQRDEREQQRRVAKLGAMVREIDERVDERVDERGAFSRTSASLRAAGSSTASTVGVRVP